MSPDANHAVVIGSGPNGLAAAITLARAGCRVTVLEAEPTPGGGVRSHALTLPGFTHDLCSAFHPLAVASPFFRSLALERLGLEWVHPEVYAAHPLDDSTAGAISRSIDATANTLGGPAVAKRYRELVTPFLDRWDDLLAETLAPMHLPRHPLLLARFAMQAIKGGSHVARSLQTPQGKGLFAGMAAHGIVPLETVPAAAMGLMLLLSGHACGWPFPRGGTQRLTDALVASLNSLGGSIETGQRVNTMADLPPAKLYLFDVTPRQLLRIAGENLPANYRRKLKRFRYGPGVFKVDWALSGPVPWKAEACRRSGVVHVGGTLEEIADDERRTWHGEHVERPFVLFGQQSLFDPTRAPPGKQTGWGYCHVPNGSTVDMTERIEAQVERFAPGFRDLILARSTHHTAQMESRNANYIGGDIAGGAMHLKQVLARPILSSNPYATGNPTIWLCSSSTPPGAGVHGMCGYHAARAALKKERA